MGAGPVQMQDAVMYHCVASLMGLLKPCEAGVSLNLIKLCASVTDGPLFSWWVGGPDGGQVQTYLGGQCSCGLQQNCVDPKHHCDCDAARNEWCWILSWPAFPALRIILIIPFSPSSCYLPGRVIQAF